MNTKPKKNVILEYVWIDVSGKTRSKNKVITIEVDEKLKIVAQAEKFLTAATSYRQNKA